MDKIFLREYCEQIDNVIERGHYVEAVAHGRHILKQYPKHIVTHQLLGKAMLEAGQGEYAADMFDVEARKRRREEVFPEECRTAYEMGKRLATVQ